MEYIPYEYDRQSFLKRLQDVVAELQKQNDPELTGIIQELQRLQKEQACTK